MNIRAYSLTFLFIGTSLSMNLMCAEFKQDDYKGMQLAWVRLPSPSTTTEGTDAGNAKTKPVQAPVSKKPIQYPVEKPRQLPAAKPVQVPEVKPAQAPIVKPVQVPVVIPAQLPVTKPVQAHEAKRSQVAVIKETHAFEWVIAIGADFGGDELGKVYYTDGSSASVKANNGIVFNVGGLMVNGIDSNFSTQLTLGYKIGGPRGDNGDVTWSALPLDVIEYYRAASLRLGLGLGYQISPQLSVNLPNSKYIDKYDNAVGLIAQIGWAPVRESYSIDLRYTSIKFQRSDGQSPTLIDGSVAGLYASYRF